MSRDTLYLGQLEHTEPRTCANSRAENAFPPLTDESIRAAVQMWASRRQEALETYGPVDQWNTSSVTDMSRLFEDYCDLNDDISGWDVSSVTNMSDMFRGATSFNGDVSGWDVSSVTNMSYMFIGATEDAPSPTSTS